ncbi:hypothetical protein L288_20005 [Sphingobium quisquiliarum P25]|uniref:Glycosyltransferase RgtA/B/C/D-like domain-containing protein n=1 Tax=Sphingobium quisquiliarum P25 TaxID=1329909 RepID=T0GH20_9SPHN|nr:hypothetical protein [Sphingobium quisquiliarum]EQA99317.1 hypothetical protein L288_20005 [Sphingobium quisquiliarum P25]
MPTRRIDAGRALFAALILLTLVRYGLGAFASGPWTMADDARQFLSWGARIGNPSAMPHDLLADYWQQAAPPLYRALLFGAHLLGIGPVQIASLLAFPLIIASAMLAWRLAGCFTPDQGRRLIAALCVMAAILHNDSIFSGTPRAFASPLILMMMLGMARRRHGLTLAGLLLSSLIYPAPAITCLGVFALHLLGWPLVLRWRSLATLTAAAIVVGGTGLFFKAGLSVWGPTLTLEEARHVYSLASFDGRSSITGRNGGIAWLCSARIGFLPAIVNCQGNTDPRLLLNLILSVLPMIGLWLARRRAHGGDGPDRDAAWRLLPYSLLSSLICYTLAAVTAFTFHLPARYSQPVLLVMGSLALGLLIGTIWTRATGRLARARPILRTGAIGLALLIGIAAFATPKMRLVRPAHPDLLALVASTPPGTRIAGVEDDLAVIPARTGRTVLATPEHDIPYHRRYHREHQALLRASVAMGQMSAPALASEVRRLGVDLLIFDRHFLQTGVLPESYGAALPPPHRIAPSLEGLAMLRAKSCRVVETAQWVAIFTSCLKS